MIRVADLLSYYPENLRTFRTFILREYLQYKILQIIFDNPDYSRQLCFLGGTCLRIVHDNFRFSEDIDFDNFQLTEPDFQSLSDSIKKQLEREGYEVQMKTVYKGAYHCYIRFPALLFDEGLSGHREQKILIQLDTEPQNYEYHPVKYILNRFDVFTEIPVTPPEILLAQKFYSILNRKRAKGRDFFDVIFLLSKDIRPDYGYLKMKTGLSDRDTLTSKVLEKCASLNMKTVARDVAPFLFNATEAKKVELFENYLNQVKL